MCRKLTQDREDRAHAITTDESKGDLGSSGSSRHTRNFSTAIGYYSLVPCGHLRPRSRSCRTVGGWEQEEWPGLLWNRHRDLSRPCPSLVVWAELHETQDAQAQAILWLLPPCPFAPSFCAWKGTSSCPYLPSKTQIRPGNLVSTPSFDIHSRVLGIKVLRGLIVTFILFYIQHSYYVQSREF